MTKHTITGNQVIIQQIQLSIPERFASYMRIIAPQLREKGYQYFVACPSDEYIEHCEWCADNCSDYTLAHHDVWQIAPVYPRAFANQADAVLFMLTFAATQIGGAK